MPQHRNAGGPFLIFEPGLGVTGSLQCAGKIAITSESSTPPQPAAVSYTHLTLPTKRIV